MQNLSDFDLTSSLIEYDIENCKRLYHLAKNHKESRKDILNSLTNQIQLFQEFLANVNYSGITSKEFDSLIERSDDVLKSLFTEKKIFQEFNSVPTSFETLTKSTYGNTDNILQNVLNTYQQVINDSKIKRQKTVQHRLSYLNSLRYCLTQYGLHSNIMLREGGTYCIYFETKDSSLHIKLDLTEKALQNDFVSRMSNINNKMLINGFYLKVSEITKTYIVSHKFKEDEVWQYCESKGILYDGSVSSKANFVKSLDNLADKFLPKEVSDFSLDQDVLQALVELKSLLISPKNFNKSERNAAFVNAQQIVRNHPEAWEKASYLIKQFHSYDEFFENKKLVFDLPTHITNEFIPVISFIEDRTRLIINSKVKETLNSLSIESITRNWEKAVQNIDNDPEDSISRSKTLLETILKQILDSKKVTYDTYGENFPGLYKLVSKELSLTPGGEYDAIFNQILNGCSSVVQGVNAARGKLGLSHGKNNEQLKNLPLSRHAELMVNLSGAMAVFLIKTWKNIE